MAVEKTMRVPWIMLALSPMACVHAPNGRMPAPTAPSEAGPVVDKTVAVVLGQPITLSECEMEVRIERVRAGNLQAVLNPVTPLEEAKVLPELIDRAAILRSLKATNKGTLDPAAPRKEVERMQQLLGDPQWARFLDKVELSQQDLEERLRSTMEAQTILMAKLAEQIKVDRKDVEAWRTAHPGASQKEAERALAMESADQQQPGILAEARKTTGARVLDPIVAGPARAPEAVEGTAH